MFIDNWEQFYQQARELFIAEPIRTRYCLRYRHCDGKFYLKVTDDRTCIQFKSDQQVDLKRLEQLNALMFAGMAAGPEAAESSFLQQQLQQQGQSAAASTAQTAQQGGRKTNRRRG